jgi:Ca-activated chloride channel family protein
MNVLIKWTIALVLMPLFLSAAPVQGASLAVPWQVDCAPARAVASGAQSIQLSVAPGSAMAPAGETSTAYVKVSLRGRPMAAGERTPANVCLVIDQSGSMAGQKIADARAAAVNALGRLGAGDIISVVAYNDNARVAVAPRLVGDAQGIVDAIMRIEAGGNTALHAGVSLGAAQLRKRADEYRTSRLILLSDGLANVGPSSTEDLIALGTQCASDGIVVSTVGLGMDYNEDLMARMATAAGGGHYFAKNSDELPGIYDVEFANLTTVVATGAVVEFLCPSGVRPLRVIGRDATIDGQRVEVKVGHVYGDGEKYIILEVEVPAGKTGDSILLTEARLRFHSKDDGLVYESKNRAKITLTDNRELVKAHMDREVMVSVMRQISMENNRLAMELMDRGEHEAAAREFTKNGSITVRWAGELDAPELRKDGEMNFLDAESIASGTYKERRKTIIYNQINTFKQEGLQGKTLSNGSAE